MGDSLEIYEAAVISKSSSLLIARLSFVHTALCVTNLQIRDRRDCHRRGERWSVVPISPTLGETWDRLVGLIPKLAFTPLAAEHPAPPGRPLCKNPGHSSRGQDPRSVYRDCSTETFPQERQRKGWPPRESGNGSPREKNAYTRWSARDYPDISKSIFENRE